MTEPTLQTLDVNGLRMQVAEPRAGGRLRDELTFTSFRHGGATEATTSGLSDREMMVKGQWTSPKMLKNYVHKNDEMHVNAHEKRQAKRAKK